MKVVVTKEYFQAEDEIVKFFEPLEKERSVDDIQKTVDAYKRLVKELKNACQQGRYQ